MINLTRQQLGNYHLIRKLGSGGFADVYLGEHLHLKTLAAIKVLRTPLSALDGQPFVQEARTIAQLKHPHIVRVLDFGIDGATPFLVMDYAPKGTLRQAHQRGSVLPLSLVVAYVRQAAAALQYAHDAKLIHRDVKPENLLLDSGDEVLLSDFGIAVAAHNTSSLQTLDLAGTPAYMAPELIQGKPRPASDQYALAIVVYEWLCGGPPFEWHQVLHQQLAVPAPPLREKVPSIPLAVEQVVLRALAKDPQQRFPSVGAFATALEQAAQQRCGGTTLYTYSGHDHRVTSLAWSPNGGRIASIDLAGQVHLWDTASGRLLSLNQGLHFDSSPVETLAWSPDGQYLASSTDYQHVMVWNAATEVCTLRTLTPGRVDVVAWSPDGRCIASESFRGDDGQNLLYAMQVWDVQTGEEVFTHSLRVSGEGLPVFALQRRGTVSFRWLSDSRRIAVVRLDGIMEVWDIATGRQLSTRHYRGGTDTGHAVFWSPDGKRVAAIMLDQSVEVWDASAGNVLCAYRGHTGQVRHLAWSPDSQSLASAGPDGMIHVWDAVTGKYRLTYCDAPPGLGGIAWSPEGQRVASASRDHVIRICRTG